MAHYFFFNVFKYEISQLSVISVKYTLGAVQEIRNNLKDNFIAVAVIFKQLVRFNSLIDGD